MWIAHRAGIRVFATGGIGGVHRGSLPDVSADLPELARTPMIVVCSGAKIVLDLPATREWLETNSGTVIGYQCDEMPAFYSRSSDLPVDVRCDSPEEVAKIFQAQRDGPDVLANVLNRRPSHLADVQAFVYNAPAFGGKGMRGPQNAGLLLGRADLIAAATKNMRARLMPSIARSHT